MNRERIVVITLQLTENQVPQVRETFFLDIHLNLLFCEPNFKYVMTTVNVNLFFNDLEEKINYFLILKNN